VPAVRLVIAGDGDQRPALESQVSARGLSDKVRFLGWRRDLVQLYGGVEALVLSSLNEGTPVALIEAMASGRPVVATAVGGVPDLVTHGRSGLLVPPGEPTALADAMLQLAASPEMRAAFGAAGRLAARAFDWHHLVEALTGLYVSGVAGVRGQRGDGGASPS
jgi:glycosyltransferase involved in cell wall biosynthesis